MMQHGQDGDGSGFTFTQLGLFEVEDAKQKVEVHLGLGSRGAWELVAIPGNRLVCDSAAASGGG
jgi:hypothetical protein